jgi:hypothetical protein
MLTFAKLSYKTLEFLSLASVICKIVHTANKQSLSDSISLLLLQSNWWIPFQSLFSVACQSALESNSAEVFAHIVGCRLNLYEVL